MSLWSRDLTTCPFSSRSRGYTRAFPSGVISADVAGAQRLSAEGGGELASSPSSPPQPASTPTTSSSARRNVIDSASSVPYATFGLQCFQHQDDRAEDARDGCDRGHDPSRRAAMNTGLVDGRVALAPGEQPAVDRVGGGSRKHECNCEAPPEHEVAETGLERAGNDEHERVVDDLHHADADRVRRERDREHRPQRKARTEQREASEGIADEE